MSLSSRATVRTLRSIHPRTTPSSVIRARQTLRRTYADSAPTSAPSGSSHALLGGLAGGAVAVIAGYTWYSVSGAKTAVNSIHSTKQYFDSGIKKLQNSAPEPNEALEWLRSTALSYTAIIPGAKGYVNSAFNDLDAIRSKHGEKVDAIVSDTYKEVKSTMQKDGVSLSTASKVWSVIEKSLKDISSLAGDAAEDIMNNHPEIKKSLGGNFDQLKNLGETLGPEAKEQVDKTWEQISSIVSKGLSVSTIPEIKKLVEEKTEVLRKLGDQAYQKGLEQAKPYLDKSPKVKELIEKNADALKSGDTAQLWNMVKEAASSGDTKDFEKYVQSAVEKGKSAGKTAGVDVDSYLKMFPGLDQVGDKLKQLQEVGQKHGKEAQDLLKSTMDEIKQVLEKKTEDAKKIAEKAGKEGKQ